jgi:hypothetical protein
MEELISDSIGEALHTVRNGWSTAAQRALAKGLPVTIAHDGRNLRIYPDGRVEDVGPIRQETPEQIVARLEMSRSEGSRFELVEIKLSPKLREVALTAAAPGTNRDGRIGAGTKRAPGVSTVTPKPTAAGDDASSHTAQAKADTSDATTSAASDAAEYNLKVMAVACANAKTMFEFTGELMQVKTLADMVQLLTKYAGKQIEAGTEHAKKLAAAAEKIATTTASAAEDGHS